MKLLRQWFKDVRWQNNKAVNYRHMLLKFHNLNDARSPEKRQRNTISFHSFDYFFVCLLFFFAFSSEEKQFLELPPHVFWSKLLCCFSAVDFFCRENSHFYLIFLSIDVIMKFCWRQKIAQLLRWWKSLRIFLHNFHL